MAKYQITAPDGTKYQITAPDSASQADVLAYAQSQHVAPNSAPAASPAPQQPSLGQTIMASPVGRFAHDAILAPISGIASLLSKIDPTGGSVAPMQQKAEQFYQGAIQAQQNRPGYAKARAAADAQAKARGAGGFTDQVMAPLAPAMAGAAGLFGGMNASNAAADAQTAAQTGYAKENPVSAAVGQTIGGLMATPAGGAAAIPAAIPRQIAPKISDLKNAAQAAYKRAENSGVIVASPSYDTMVSDLQAKLANEGIDQTLHPNSLAAYNRLKDAKGQNITFKGLDTQRKIAGDAVNASATNPSDKRMGYIIQNHIDDYVDKLAPTDLVGGASGGNVQQAVTDLNSARDFYSRYAQAQTIQKQIDKATIKAGQYSQSGMENATRAQFRQLALNDKAMSRLTPEVQAAVKQVAAGTATNNALRLVGKFAPHGVVSASAGAGLGFLAGGPAGAIALPLAGEAARFGAAALTRSAAKKALETAALGRSGLSPLPPALQLPQLTNRSQVPLGLFGSSYQTQNQ